MWYSTWYQSRSERDRAVFYTVFSVVAYISILNRVFFSSGMAYFCTSQVALGQHHRLFFCCGLPADDDIFPASHLQSSASFPVTCRAALFFVPSSISQSPAAISSHLCCPAIASQPPAFYLRRPIACSFFLPIIVTMPTTFLRCRYLFCLSSICSPVCITSSIFYRDLSSWVILFLLVCFSVVLLYALVLLLSSHFLFVILYVY